MVLFVGLKGLGVFGKKEKFVMQFHVRVVPVEAEGCLCVTSFFLRRLYETFTYILTIGCLEFSTATCDLSITHCFSYGCSYRGRTT
jgi:hypothetical protein